MAQVGVLTPAGAAGVSGTTDNADGTLARFNNPAGLASESPCAGATPGSYVQLTLASGEKVSGSVRELTDSAITLERPRNGAFKERQVALAGIQEVKVLEDGSAGRVKVTWFSAGISLLAALFVYAALSLEIDG